MSDQRAITWAKQLKSILADRLFVELGLDEEEHQIFDAPSNETLSELLLVAPEYSRVFLQDLFSECGGLSLPEVNHGYFIDPPARLLRRLKMADPLEPRHLESDSEVQVLCFGSDGGGGRFAFLDGKDPGVWYLPVGGVFDGLFRDGQTPLAKIAKDVPEFGKRLVADVVAFVNGDDNWRFIGATQ